MVEGGLRLAQRAQRELEALEARGGAIDGDGRGEVSKPLTAEPRPQSDPSSPPPRCRRPRCTPPRPRCGTSRLRALHSRRCSCRRRNCRCCCRLGYRSPCGRDLV